jgi:hypothetical protein
MISCKNIIKTDLSIGYIYCLLSIILMIFLLMSGCIEPGYQPNHDVGVVKLTSAGITDWGVLVTTGQETQAHNIIETSKGDYILDSYIANGNPANPISRPLMISRDGLLEWDVPINSSECGSYALDIDSQGNVLGIAHNGTFCPSGPEGDYAENSSGNFSVKGWIIPTSDGGLVLSGVKEESHFLTEDEFVKWREGLPGETQQYAEWLWKGICNDSTIREINSIDCKSQPIPTAIIAKTAPDMSVSWQRGLPNYSTGVIPVIEMHQGKGYLAGLGNSVFCLAPDGSISNRTLLNNVPEYKPIAVNRQNADNYSMLLDMTAILFDSNGGITGKEFLQKPQPTFYYNFAIPTRDGGFLTADIRTSQSSNMTVQMPVATKYNPDGSIEWNTSIRNPYAFRDITGLVQTSDGGYLIISEIDNQTARKK